MQTASTIFFARGVKYGSTKLAKCGEAPLESEGTPSRYLPVSTPRPSGDQAMNPRLSSEVAGITSSSDFRFRSEYSFWAQVIAALPNIGF